MLTGIESRILDDMVQSISEGKYTEHNRLPTENELANYYNVPRIHAEKVYLQLEDMGFVYSTQGKGHFLTPEKQKVELQLARNSSFSEKMRAVGYVSKTQNLGYIKIAYEENVYAHLGVEADEEVFKVSLLHFIESQPVALQLSYVTKSVFPQIEREGDHIQSMSNYYEEQGYRKSSCNKSAISITFPTSLERSLFTCSRLVPLLVVESKCKASKQNHILAYTKMIYRSDSFSYVIEDISV